MKARCFNKWFKILALALLAFVGILGDKLYNQTIISSGAEVHLARVPASGLQMDIIMAEGVRKSRFLHGVGGISFDQTARPDEQLTVKSLGLSYDDNKEDGRRLTVKLNGIPVLAEIPDWMLRPIVYYADSNYYSCVTLFGHLQDEYKAKEEEVVAGGGHIINYHPEFDNTLLGYRLFQADILTINPHATSLPQINEEYILGTGENPPDLQSNAQAYSDFIDYSTQRQAQLDQKFKSYIISDHNRDFRFRIIDGKLNITGDPYFFYWRFKMDRSDYDESLPIKELQRLIGPKSQNEAVTREKIVSALIEVAHEYEENPPPARLEGTFIEMLSKPDDGQRKEFLSRYRTEDLLSILNSITVLMDKYIVDHLEALSDEISSQPERIKAINPEVWRALVTTMRYAAFFRYCKQEHPRQWNKFKNGILHLVISPKVETPTVMTFGDKKP